VNRRLHGCEGRFEFTPANLEWLAAEITVPKAKHVEEHNGRRRLLRQHFHARGCGMEPKLKRIEVKSALRHDDDLAIEYTAGRQLRTQRL
jgi:hypothetical protein